MMLKSYEIVTPSPLLCENVDNSGWPLVTLHSYASSSINAFVCMFTALGYFLLQKLGYNSKLCMLLTQFALNVKC